MAPVIIFPDKKTKTDMLVDSSGKAWNHFSHSFFEKVPGASGVGSMTLMCHYLPQEIRCYFMLYVFFTLLDSLYAWMPPSSDQLVKSGVSRFERKLDQYRNKNFPGLSLTTFLEGIFTLKQANEVYSAMESSDVLKRDLLQAKLNAFIDIVSGDHDLHLQFLSDSEKNFCLRTAEDIWNHFPPCFQVDDPADLPFYDGLYDIIRSIHPKWSNSRSLVKNKHYALSMFIIMDGEHKHCINLSLAKIEKAMSSPNPDKNIILNEWNSVAGKLGGRNRKKHLTFLRNDINLTCFLKDTLERDLVLYAEEGQLRKSAEKIYGALSVFNIVDPVLTARYSNASNGCT